MEQEEQVQQQEQEEEEEVQVGPISVYKLEVNIRILASCLKAVRPCR